MTEMRMKCHIKYLTDVYQITFLSQEIDNSPAYVTDRLLPRDFYRVFHETNNWYLKFISF